MNSFRKMFTNTHFHLIMAEASLMYYAIINETAPAFEITNLFLVCTTAGAIAHIVRWIDSKQSEESRASFFTALIRNLLIGAFTGGLAYILIDLTGATKGILYVLTAAGAGLGARNFLGFVEYKFGRRVEKKNEENDET